MITLEVHCSNTRRMSHCHSWSLMFFAQWLVSITIIRCHLCMHWLNAIFRRWVMAVHALIGWKQCKGMMSSQHALVTAIFSRLSHASCWDFVTSHKAFIGILYVEGRGALYYFDKWLTFVTFFTFTKQLLSNCEVWFSLHWKQWHFDLNLINTAIHQLSKWNY